MAKRSKKKKSKRRVKKFFKKRKSYKKKKKSLKRSKVTRKKLSKETKDVDGNLIFKVSKKWSNQAYVNKSQYEKKYNFSIKNNEDFWAKEGKRINLIKP